MTARCIFSNLPSNNFSKCKRDAFVSFNNNTRIGCLYQIFWNAMLELVPCITCQNYQRSAGYNMSVLAILSCSMLRRLGTYEVRYRCFVHRRWISWCTLIVEKATKWQAQREQEHLSIGRWDQCCIHACCYNPLTFTYMWHNALPWIVFIY